MQYTITVTEDKQIHGMTEFKVIQGENELMKFSSFNVRKSLQLASDFIADNIEAAKEASCL